MRRGMGAVIAARYGCPNCGEVWRTWIGYATNEGALITRPLGLRYAALRATCGTEGWATRRAMRGRAGPPQPLLA